MINDAFLTKIIKIKLKACDRMLDMLPEGVKDPAKEVKATLLSALHQATQEYADPKPSGEGGKTVTRISID